MSVSVNDQAVEIDEAPEGQLMTLQALSPGLA